MTSRQMEMTDTRPCTCAPDERDAALTDLATAQKNAERYRWLRSRFRVFGPHIDGNLAWCATGDIGRLRGLLLDAAIDAALEREE